MNEEELKLLSNDFLKGIKKKMEDTIKTIDKIITERDKE